MSTHAAMVHDPFHVAPKITDAVDTVRKQEFTKADAATRKKFTKKRFLILKRRKTLKTLMAENERLYQAYLRKEQTLNIFEERDEETALKRLDKCFENVKKVALLQFGSVVKTITSYLDGLVNYFKHRFTNAASEAFNTKINSIKRRAYGFHDLDWSISS